MIPICALLAYLSGALIEYRRNRRARNLARAAVAMEDARRVEYANMQEYGPLDDETRKAGDACLDRYREYQDALAKFREAR